MKQKIMLRLTISGILATIYALIAKITGHGMLDAFASGTAAFIACYVMLMPKPRKESDSQYKMGTLFSKQKIIEIILFIGLTSMLLGLIV
ncbi:hypothetical protein GAH_00566 [Geoglobus ahangari]|uniref:Uncharacterized protein n=1 Tax=Geoglobus ahangari TaxID=113653 RepID=A0A0F7IFZ9_9EURY|nr:hypothetical protein [Geoglobus ahangari]AKG92090.1 hypothetical protein GAH_00566 [Geoglobus ahangari]